jgi:hypothetical protein
MTNGQKGPQPKQAHMLHRVTVVSFPFYLLYLCYCTPPFAFCMVSTLLLLWNQEQFTIDPIPDTVLYYSCS